MVVDNTGSNYDGTYSKNNLKKQTNKYICFGDVKLFITQFSTFNVEIYRENVKQSFLHKNYNATICETFASINEY